MNTYIYTDNSKIEKLVVFVCDAQGILEADKLYQKTTGFDVVKQGFIGCRIKKKEGES